MGDMTTLLQTLPDVVVVVGADGRLVWGNDVWKTTFGASSADGELLTARIHPDDLHEVSITAGRDNTFTCRTRTVDGGWTWLAWSIRWSDGQGVATARDVSAAVEVESGLRDNLRLWELAAEASRLGYWVIDLRADTVYWSPEIYRIHGLDPATHTPTIEHGVQSYHPEDREAVARVVQRAADTGEPFDFELRLLQPDGTVRLVLTSGRAHMGDDGKAVRLIGIFRDVTEERARAVQAAEAEVLARSNEQLERFAYAVSHDLKAPLRGIRMCADWIAADPNVQGSADTLENLEFMHSRVRRLEAMIDGVLELSRATGLRTPPTSVDLHAVVEQLAGILPGPVTVDPLPSVRGDAVQLERVLQNLLANAFDHGATRVHVHEVAPGEVAIDDDGPGVPEEHREVLFELFRTLRPRDETNGSGVGLAIVDALMKQLGGSVAVHDSPLGGARFCLTFPEVGERS